MLKINKTILLIFILAISLFGEDMKDKYSGISLPDKLGSFSRTKIIDNEIENPGLGTTIYYNRPGVKATIYIYNMGEKLITDGINSPFLKNSFSQAKNDIKKAAELGYYKLTSDIKTSSTFLNVQTSATPVLKAKFTYLSNDNNNSSILYLTALNNNFFKIRITYLTSDEDRAPSVIEEFLQEVSYLIKNSYTQWKVVNEFDKSKVYLNKNYIEEKGNLLSSIVIYSLNPSGTDKINGKSVNEMLMFEEYDISIDKFRVHSMLFFYEDGTQSNPMRTELEWKPAVGGNKNTLDFLKSTIKEQ